MACCRRMKLARTGFALTLVAALGFATLLRAESRRPLPPLDQAAQDSSFLAFRDKLQTSIRARDPQMLYGALEPQVFYSFPPNQGVAGLKAGLRLEDRNSPFWGILDTLLAQGGGFIRAGLFAAPYVPFTWPEELDAEAYVAVTDPDAPGRETAAAEATIVGRLSYEIVKLADPWPKAGDWVHVELPDGRTGFLEKKYCRGAVDWRAGFEKLDGKWRLKFLLGRD